MSILPLLIASGAGGLAIGTIFGAVALSPRCAPRRFDRGPSGQNDFPSQLHATPVYQVTQGPHSGMLSYSGSEAPIVILGTRGPALAYLPQDGTAAPAPHVLLPGETSRRLEVEP